MSAEKRMVQTQVSTYCAHALLFGDRLEYYISSRTLTIIITAFTLSNNHIQKKCTQLKFPIKNSLKKKSVIFRIRLGVAIRPTFLNEISHGFEYFNGSTV